MGIMQMIINMVEWQLQKLALGARSAGQTWQLLQKGQSKVM
jgi:hypothetical protein